MDSISMMRKAFLEKELEAVNNRWKEGYDKYGDNNTWGPEIIRRGKCDGLYDIEQYSSVSFYLKTELENLK